jgi:PmbA protein
MVKKYALSLVSLVDDASKTRRNYVLPFDGEGVPFTKKHLNRSRNIKGFPLQYLCRAKEGKKSTGNGIRNSYKSTRKLVRPTFYVENGTLTKNELMKQIEKGIYITDVMGMHTANPISGDFSLGAAGLLIEKGEFTQPVRGIAIAGNIFELINNVDAVGSDLTFFVGKGSPTLRIEKMTISGS